MLQEDLEKYREKAETLSAQLSSFKSQVQSLQASKDTDEAATANRLTNLEESLLRAQEEVRAEHRAIALYARTMLRDSYMRSAH